MATQAAKAFQAYLEAQDLHNQFVDDEEKVIRVGLNLEATEIDIYSTFSDDDKDVHFDGINFVKIPADKKDLVYRLCNECNNKYRWVKFVWDEDHSCVTVQADAVIDLETGAEECFGIIMRMAGIVRDAYPIFMKAIWA